MAGETLADFARRGDISISTGPFGSALHAHDYQPMGIAVVPTEAISPRGLLHDRLIRISREKARELERHKLQEGDIVFARRGVQACGISTLISSSDGEVIAGTGVITLRIQATNKIDPRFFACIIGSNDSVKWLKHHAIGATMPNLNSSVILSLPITLPPLADQRSIAHILGTLDDKIELNRRTNETLESMARTLFKAWFVDFEPVRAKMEGRWQRDQSLPGLPAHLYDIFPDRLIDSALGEVPEGWLTGSLIEVAAHPRRTVQPNKINNETNYIALEHMPKRCIALSNWSKANDLESNKYEFKHGEILFGKLRPYFHKVGVAPVDGVCSTDIIVIAPKIPIWFGFVLAHISSDAFVEYTNAGSTGTKMPRTSWPEMARYSVAIPSEGVAAAFNQKIKMVSDKIIAKIHESKTLSQIRDALLPKLISGELRIHNAEAFLKERGL